MKNLRKIVKEFKGRKRTLIVNGSFHENQGFTIFPVKNDELDIYLSEDDNHRISRKITIEEAKELVENQYCTNKEAANAFLDSL